MRSVKLLVAAAAVAALVAGPVLAQDAGAAMAPAGSTTAAPAKAHVHKHSTKHKHSKHKTGSTTSAPVTTPAQ